MPTPNEPHRSQQLDWGSIRWLIEPGRGGVESVSAGLFTFNPRSVQEEHVHVGYEQLLYVVSGRGWHVVNGETVPLDPASLVYIPPFAKHIMHNDGDEPLLLISLYFPSRTPHVPDELKKLYEEEFTGGSIWSFLDLEALDVLLEKLSQALGFRLSLVDIAGNPISNSSNRPPFCAMLRDASNGRHCRQRLREAIRKEFPREDMGKKPARGVVFMCCNSIASILIPVYGGKQVAGYIKCGEAFFSKSDQSVLTAAMRQTSDKYGLSPEDLLQAAAGVRVEMKSVLYAAAEATLAIANYITEMAVTAMRRVELDKSRVSLAEEQMTSAKLEKALREADFKLLQSQINPHFLFNTLNTVSQMAYVEGNHDVAKVLWSLSDLLRFTLRRTEEFIPLREEIKLLQDYTLIQQTRYHDRLSVDWDIDPAVDDVPVPCMLLQPLMENAIIHGIEPRLGPGRVSITARKEKDMLYLGIVDNGIGFIPDTDCSEPGHIGIASVRSRLQYYFNGASDFSIESIPGKGTEVVIRLPVMSTAVDSEGGRTSHSEK